MYGDGLIPLTQSEIAAMAGSTRHTANRVLRSAEAEGLLERGRNQVRVLDLERLRRMAEAG
jgi:DNA-binding MarR family transcriptional regulator